MQDFTQYITYRSLLEKKQEQGFSEAEAKDILRQVLSQLIRLHELKKAHGSISLDTVAHDAKRMQIVLLTGDKSNKPIYLAPEVLQTGLATPAADIYALGILIIELLTGLPPEDLKTRRNTWDWADRCKVSAQFTQVLNLALSSDLDFRYANAGQMLRELQKPIITPSITKIEPAIATSTNSISNSSSSNTIDLSEYLARNRPELASRNQPSHTIPSSSEFIDSELMDTESLILAEIVKSTNESPQVDFHQFSDSRTHINNKLDVSQVQVMSNNKTILPDSPTYRKSKFSRNSSQASDQSKTIILITIPLAIGVIGLIGAYFYMQLKSADTIKANSQFANSVNSAVKNAIAGIYEAKKVDESMEKTLNLAKAKYGNTGNLSEANNILQAIPADSRIRPKADKLLGELQLDATKNAETIQKAEKAFREGNWQLAIEKAKNISATPFWQLQGKKIAENAKQKLVKKVSAPLSNSVTQPSTAIPPIAEPPLSQSPPAPIQDLPPAYSPPSESAPVSPDPEPRVAPPPPRVAN